MRTAIIDLATNIRGNITKVCAVFTALKHEGMEFDGIKGFVQWAAFNAIHIYIKCQHR